MKKNSRCSLVSSVVQVFRNSIWVLCLLAPGFIFSNFDQQSREDADLKRVLNGMDSAARDFRTFKAKFSQKKYTAILKEFDDTPEIGEFYYSRAKDGSVLMRHEVLTPGKRITTVKGETGIIYRPSIKEAQIVERKKMQSYLEYLALGIGQSSSKLQERFRISYVGGESVNKVPCSVLAMIPKDPKVGLDSITVWLGETNWVPVQYKFLEPSKDYLLITFSEERMNVKIPSSKFEQELPPGTDKQRL